MFVFLNSCREWTKRLRVTIAAVVTFVNDGSKILYLCANRPLINFREWDYTEKTKARMMTVCTSAKETHIL